MHETVRLEDVVEETPKIKTLLFKSDLEAKAGQFVMVWVPGVDEVPMSLSYTGNPKGITVNNIGLATKTLCSLKPGDKIGIRGPFGTSFDFSKKPRMRVLAVGGGVGMAPIAPAVEEASMQSHGVTCAIGSRTASELLFIRRLEKVATLDVSTDDGTAGQHGLVTVAAERLLKERDYDLLITCGPEIMMAGVLALGKKHNVPVQLSVERYMKCGVGICDACSLGNGLLVCRDGPVVLGDTLHGTDFGRCCRESSGKKVQFKWAR